MKGLLKYLISLVILLHCTGVTQLVAAYTKDTSALIGMVNMNEEETKKEKESKEDTDHSKEFHQKISSLIAAVSFADKHIYYCGSKSRISHQFVIELPTPPPDSLV